MLSAATEFYKKVAVFSRSFLGETIHRFPWLKLAVRVQNTSSSRTLRESSFDRVEAVNTLA
jgi:siderophore synthetase component